MKKLFLLTVALAALNANAVITYSTSPVNSMVPDNNTNGWVSSIVINDQAGSTIAPGTLQVNLELSGGYNGDLYAYLVSSGGGFAVLLDRVGYTGTGFGYSTSGMEVWLTDSTGAFIETTPNPGFVGTTYSRNGYAGSLGSFDNLNVNGTWSLFVADLSGGSISTVQSWGLQMDIVAVPEVETWVAAALAGMFGAFWLNRQIWGHKGAPQS